MITLRYPKPQADLVGFRLTGVPTNCNTTFYPNAMATGEFFSPNGDRFRGLPWGEDTFRSKHDILRVSKEPVNAYRDKYCYHSHVDAKVSWSSIESDPMYAIKGDLDPKDPHSNLFSRTPSLSVHPMNEVQLPPWTTRNKYGNWFRAHIADGGSSFCTPVKIRDGSNPIIQGASLVLSTEVFGLNVLGLLDDQNAGLHSCEINALWSHRLSDERDAPVFVFNAYFPYSRRGFTQYNNASVWPGWSIRVYERADIFRNLRCWRWVPSNRAWYVTEYPGSNSWSRYSIDAFKDIPNWINAAPSPSYCLRVSECELAIYAAEQVAIAAEYFPFSQYRGPMWSTSNFSVLDVPIDEVKEEVSHSLGLLAAAGDAYVGSGLSSLTDYESLGNQVLAGCSKFSDNLIAYVADLKKAGDVIRSIIGLATNIKNPKAWASAWLSFRYSDRLTWKDTLSLTKAIYYSLDDLNPLDSSSNFFVRARSAERQVGSLPFFASSGTVQLFQKSYFVAKDLSRLMKLVRKMMEWDAWPTLENVWDMIPLSFVVDWFADVGGLLRGIDNGIYRLYVDIPSSLVTEKVIYKVDPSKVIFPVPGLHIDEASVVVYRRRHTDFFHWNPIGTGLQIPSNINILDGISLLIQRR